MSRMPPALARVSRSKGAERRSVLATLAAYGITPAPDYIWLMEESDGVEGPVGAQGYLVLWALANLATHNQAYHVDEFAPDLFLIGSDGGDTALAFSRRRPGTFLTVPFVGLSDEAAVPVGSSLADLVGAVSYGE